MRNMPLTEAEILSNYTIAKEIFQMQLRAPEIAANAKPGQFVMVYLDSGQFMLPRPISICDANPHTAVITLVYQVVGGGTKIMSEKQAGSKIKLLAPLGNGFYNPKSKCKKVALVGGGIGTAPLFLLAKHVKYFNSSDIIDEQFNSPGIIVDVYLGFRDEPIPISEFASLADRLFIATEDGSTGHHGRILDILNESEYDEIFACGPIPMLRALQSKVGKITTQLSLEERMGCGIGTCVGCVVKVENTYTRICCEGPVFYSSEVRWK